MKCKNNPQLQLKGERTPLFLLGVGVFLLLLPTVSAGGFASSYIKSVNGEHYFEVPLGEERSYFIYPQNQDDEAFVVKIELTDDHGLLINPLEEQYTVPANTLSDGFPIELRLRLPDNATNETEYNLKYSVLTSSIADGSGTVEFSPVGFTKDFFVTANQVEEDEDETPSTTTPPTDDDGSSGGGGSSGSSGSGGTSDGLQNAIEDLNKTNNTEQNVDFEETTEILPTITEENVIDDSSSNKLLMLSIIGGLIMLMVVGTTIILKSDKE